MIASTVAVLNTGAVDDFIEYICSGDTCTPDPDSPLAGFSPDITIDGFDFESPEYQAVMSYGGISFAQSRVQGERQPVVGDNEVLTYGGWSEHHFFGVESRFFNNTEAPDRVSLYSYSFGDASGTNPDDSGSGTWNGVAIGVNAAERFENRSLLTADVTVSIADFVNPMVDVMFDNLRDLRTGDAITSIPLPSWNDLELTDGSFGKSSGTLGQLDRNRIAGQFYGPGHEEVGGIFEYATVAGSFGAARDDQ